MTVFDLVQIALRTIIVYLFLILILRLVGKRALGNYSPFDLILALVISQIIAAPLLGELPLLPAMALIGALAGLHWLAGWLSWRSQHFEQVLRGTPRILIHNGDLNRRALAAEMMSLEQLARLLREHDVELLSEVKLATFECDGTLTVIKTDEAREIQRGDLSQLLVHLQEDAANEAPA
jgi:uncharacterized membrane protein YcaP (DUF421 family)